MRSLATLVATLLIPTAALAADVTTTPHPGIKRVRRTTASQNINVLVVDLCAAGVSIRATKSGERQRTVSSFGALVGAQAAINGDFFSYTNYSTNGPSMGDGAAWGGSDHNYVAPAQFGARQVALPGHGSTAGVEPWAKQVVSGHPSLIVNGTKLDNSGDTLCTARHPRTALGFSADKKKLILAVVDGRATARLGYTCAELGNLMAEFGAANAVNLDGGGSSAMWVGGTGVINYPSDGSQRVVANHLAVRAKGTGDAPHCPAELTATFAGASHDTAGAPLELRSGEESVVWLELENTGNTTWSPSSTRVGTQDEQDRASTFFKAENWVSPNRPTGADETYAPGATGRFTWAMVAPAVSETTTFDETFQLVEEGVAWFGPKTTLAFTVHPTTGPTDQDDDAVADGGGCSTGRGSSGWLVLVIVALALQSRRGRYPHRHPQSRA